MTFLFFFLLSFLAPTYLPFLYLSLPPLIPSPSPSPSPPLTSSPIGEVFHSRLRQFPSLTTCCTIDWFSEWPDETLQSVVYMATTHVKNVVNDIFVFLCAISPSSYLYLPFLCNLFTSDASSQTPSPSSPLLLSFLLPHPLLLSHPVH